MKQLPPNLTADQLKVYEAIQRNQMAWTALVVVLGLFAVGFIVFIYALLAVPSQEVAKTAFGGIDFLLGWSIKAIVSSLFPSKRPLD